METSSPRPIDRARAIGRGQALAVKAGRLILAGLTALLLLWAFGAAYFDFPGRQGPWVAPLWAGGTVAAIWRMKGRGKWLAALGAFLVVLIPWLTKQPSNTRDWEPAYLRTPTIEVDGDQVTIHDFRNFDYASGGRVIPAWETRTFHLSSLRGVDLFLNHWGSEYIAHPIFSFDFGPEGHAAFSVETRRENGEEFSTFGGLYKLYELIYLVGDERDFIRSRTNYRPDEDCYLYRLDIGPEKARQRFLEYVAAMNDLAQHPRFYNVINANCTTAVRSQIQTLEQGRMDWRLVLNGKLDEYLMTRGLLAVKGMPLKELKEAGHVDDAAEQAGDGMDFSAKIREGVPGFP